MDLMLPFVSLRGTVGNAASVNRESIAKPMTLLGQVREVKS